jgi:hypothetical protein
MNGFVKILPLETGNACEKAVRATNARKRR